MPFDIGTGGGRTATVSEPIRGQFPYTFGGAVEYSFCHLIYKFLEVCGGGAGAWVAGFGVQLMERIEPSLVIYARPLIDMILAVPDLDPNLRTFFTQLREPTHEAAAAILGGLATQAGGAVVGNLLGVMLAVPTKALNRLIMPAIPDIQTVLTMWHKGTMAEAQARFTLKEHGLPDGFIDQLKEVSRGRPGPGDLVQAELRRSIDYPRFVSKMKGYGFSDEDIYLLQVNAQQIPPFGDLLQAVYRKELTYDQLRAIAKKAGMLDIDITTLINSSKPIPGPTDLVRMAVREAFTDSIAAKYGYDADYPAAFPTNMALWGFSPEWAKYYWRAKWELPSPGMGYDMLHRGIIDAGTLDELLRVLDYPQYWREKLTRLSYNPLTRVDVRRMYKMGVLDRSVVKKTYQDLGYDAANAELLTRFTEVTYAPDAEDPLKDKKDMSTTLITACYKKNIITRAQASGLLAALHYISTEIEFILALADAERVVSVRPDYVNESHKDLVNIIENAYINRTIDVPTATLHLKNVGMTDSEVQLRLFVLDAHSSTEARKREMAVVGDAYKSRAITQVQVVTELGRLNVPATEQAKAIAEWEVERRIGSRRLTVKEYSDAYFDELLTLEEVTDSLRGLGYAEKDIPILLQLKLE
jgi:hypothetical protein